MTTNEALTALDFCEAFARTVARRPEEVALRSSDGETELTWLQFDGLVRRVAGGLSALGVAAGGTTALLLSNRYEAAVMDMATLHIGAVPVSFYNSAAIDSLAYLLDDAGTDVLVTETAFVARARSALERSRRKPQLVVVDADVSDGALGWRDLASPDQALSSGFRPVVSPDDLLTLVYTSGTTGVPKGVELTHNNILAQIRGLHQLGRLPADGRALSYLPFAHMGDRLCAYYMPIVMGASITYHPDGRTITTVLNEVQPTLFMAVPRIWQRLQTGAEHLIAASEQRKDLEEALELGFRLHDDRLAGILTEPGVAEAWRRHGSVLAALKSSLGLRSGELLFTGAAPLPPETLRFYAAIGVELCEAYGQSETGGIILCNPAGEARPLTNGLPLPGVEARIAEDGELLLRGPMVMKGYRGQPELTAEAFDPDGWLRTGDVFTTDEAGYYQIIDRKKEMIVSSTGKNVAPVYVENTISSTSSLIAFCVCIGDARPYTTALIALEPEAAAALTGSTDPAVNAFHPAVLSVLTDAIRNGNEGLSAAEQVRRFLVVANTWLPGTDELTPTMKLRRKPIAALYADEIEALYGPIQPRVVDVAEPPRH
jgi:long-chain acyl-CoA synthetase